MKKNHIVASLVAAGVLTAGLLVFKLHSSGSLTLPASVAALLPWGAPPTALKREFPSQANEVPVLAGDAPAVISQGEPAGDGGAAQEGGPALSDEAAPVDTRTRAVGRLSADQDVDSRIVRAQALSTMLMNDTATQSAAAGAAALTKPGVTGPAAYAGEWVGEFIGPDAGTVAVSIAPDGAVTGEGMSTMTSIGFSLSGKVKSNGQVEMTKSAVGVTSTGAVFTGSLSHAGQGKGTWVIPNYDVSGTWRLNARPAQ